MIDDKAAYAEMFASQSAVRLLTKNIFSADHKVIGKQYFGLALLAALAGIVFSWLMRVHLGWANLPIPGLHLFSPNGAPGDLMTPEYYLQLMTMHGTMMVFFVLTIAPFSAFGNYFLPIQLGAEKMAFPRCNMLAFWITGAAFLVMISSFFASDGPTLGGWTQYAPLSAIGPVGGPGQGMGVILWAASIAIFCVGQLLASVNFITTTVDLRTRGMSLWRMPLSAWSWFITSIMALVAFAALLPACVLLILDHLAGTSFFVPSSLVVNDQLQPHSGGSTLLWQHLFWFFGHPEVYIAILPAIGIVSHVLMANLRKPFLSQRTLVYSMVAIAILSYIVYGHHMFVAGMNPLSSLAFSFPTLIITIPSAIIVLTWLGSIYGSKLQINTASLFALGFISLFITGGISGFFLAQPSLDIMLHATYFVVGHFHLIMGVAAVFGIFAGTYFWFPKMYGRTMSEGLGKAHFLLTFAGAYCTFMPFHYLGLAGNVRRYQAFVTDSMQPLVPIHRFITVAALLTGAAQLIFIYNLIHSRFQGRSAPANPWRATSLEWSTPTSPPPADNFGGQSPIVHRDPFQYGVGGTGDDYVMQTSVCAEGIKTRTNNTNLQMEDNISAHQQIESPAQTGVLVLIAGVMMSFAALTSALIVRSGSASPTHHLVLPSILYVTTLLILASSISLQIARHRAAERTSAGSVQLSLVWLYITLAMGATFAGGQCVAWAQLRARGVFVATTPEASFFYLFTWAHVLLVLGGLLALLRAIRSLKRTDSQPGILHAPSTYWHFVSFLWVYLLILCWIKL